MKIASSSLQMAAAHEESRQLGVRESVDAWSPGRRVRYDLEYTQGSASRGLSAAVQISDEGRRAAARAEASGAAQREAASASAEVTRTNEAGAAEPSKPETLSPKLRLLRSVLEALVGERFRVYGDCPEDVPHDPPPAAGAGGGSSGAGLRVDVERTLQESERMQFQAQGVVRTADGKEIGFSVQLQLERSFVSAESAHLQVGAPPKDPLVLSYPGHAPELSDTRFRFDLDGDGSPENIGFVKSGSGFLVFDRNGDGQVNDGRELFGTRTGDGFAELAALDADANGWIDENDADFGRLRLWTKDADGNDRLQDLRSANIGALSTQRTATPFSFRDAGNREQGVLRASSVFVQEDGTAAGTVSQVDLVA